MAKLARFPGVDEEVLKMLDANMDEAPARRRAREAFKEIQLGIDHVLFKMPHDDLEMKESYEVNSRGLEIFSKSWFPKSSRPKAVVCFCHGYGDTCTFFFEGIAWKLASCGYGVFAIDYPGFGLSEGLHGYIPSFDRLVDDVIEHYSKVKGIEKLGCHPRGGVCILSGFTRRKYILVGICILVFTCKSPWCFFYEAWTFHIENPELSALPSFLFGESMGGAVALKVHLKQPNAWSGAILVAPMCKIADDMVPSPLLKQILIGVANFFPKQKLVPQKDLAEAAFKDAKKKELTAYNIIGYKDKPRLRTALEMLRTTQEIEHRLEEVSLPLLILHGEADIVTDPSVSKALHEKASSSDKKLQLYKDAYHSLLEGESDEMIMQVFEDIISWLDEHIA